MRRLACIALGVFLLMLPGEVGLPRGLSPHGSGHHAAGGPYRGPEMNRTPAFSMPAPAPRINFAPAFRSFPNPEASGPHISRGLTTQIQPAPKYPALGGLVPRIEQGATGATRANTQFSRVDPARRWPSDPHDFIEFPTNPGMSHAPNISEAFKNQLARNLKAEADRASRLSATPLGTAQFRQQVAEKLNARWNELPPNVRQTITRRYQPELAAKLAGQWNKLAPDMQQDLVRHHAWAEGIRDHWMASPNSGVFQPDWWQMHHRRPRRSGANPSANEMFVGTEWPGLAGWLLGNWNWAQPQYYGYGTNMFYGNGTVYSDGNPVATSDQYYNQALALAQKGSTALADETADVGVRTADDWKPLGTFAITRDETQAEPSMFIQIAVRKDGVIAGAFYNTESGAVHDLVGSVDPRTQRAAWWNPEQKDNIMETGLYNLTLDETTAIMHFGKDLTQEWYLIRLPNPA